MIAYKDLEKAVRDLKQLHNRQALTLEEKYALLSQRDEIIRKCRPLTVHLDVAEPLVGLCQSMCPEKERYERQLRYRFSFYESLAARGDGSSAKKADPSLMVKEFVRSAAGSADPLPYEIRSMAALNRTMEHMLSFVIAKEPTEDGPLAGWYNFIASSLKTIRREVMQQMIPCQEAVQILETSVRFFIYASYRLSLLPDNLFDEALNVENIRLSLMALEELIENGAESSNGPEFDSYSILLDLDSIYSLSVLRKHKKPLKSPELRLAANLWLAFHKCDYIRYFRLVKKRATFLQACLAHYHVLTMRTRVLAALRKAHGRYFHQIPIETLSTWLGFEDGKTAASFCAKFGIADGGSNCKTPQPPPMLSLPPHLREVLIHSKRGDAPVQKIVRGGNALGEPLALDPPASSFDENGRYNKDPVYSYFVEHWTILLDSHKPDSGIANCKFVGSYIGF